MKKDALVIPSRCSTCGPVSFRPGTKESRCGAWMSDGGAPRGSYTV